MIVPAMRTVFHALTLNFHQPPGNLEHLLEHDEWAAKELLWTIDRMPRTLWAYEDVARVHLSLSGTLLETLSHPAFQARTYGFVKCGDLLWQLQNRKIFEVLGTGFYHPVLPLIPPADRDEHLLRWQGLAQHLFWRTNFQGFWPPEMGFCMELIPLLKRLGYRYVLVDSQHVEPVGAMRWEEIRYRPHWARHGGEEIIVVVRDRELSNAQQSGMDAGWFMQEVHQRTQHCEFPPLVTTATDGDNGGWFRNTNEQGNFWQVCYRDLLDRVRRGETEIQPAFIHEYLDTHGAAGEVTVNAGAWNTGWHHGKDFLQWTGSDAQKQALARIQEVSRDLETTSRRLREQLDGSPSLRSRLEDVRWRLLRAETSCNLFWGEAWVPKAQADLHEAARLLQPLQIQTGLTDSNPGGTPLDPGATAHAP
jgi:alpha-amylase/alpha-mannosidase (GH57 family)